MVETESCDAEGNCTTEDKPISGIMFGFHAEDTQGDPWGFEERCGGITIVTKLHGLNRH